MSLSPGASSKQQSSVSNVKQDNPLVWPLLSVLQDTRRSWKIHNLAVELANHGLMVSLDDNPEKDLFKRNFLLMNALYQLQDILLPGQWLQVHAMDIQILNIMPNDIAAEFQAEQALREYYLNWENYDVSGNIIRQMLEEFWSRYEEYVGAKTNKSNGNMRNAQALKVFQLDCGATNQDIRRQWRRLALRWHPDRSDGNAARFRAVCEAWQILRC